MSLKEKDIPAEVENEAGTGNSRTSRTEMSCAKTCISPPEMNVWLEIQSVRSAIRVKTKGLTADR
jgi:hypothetical protein